ncbi:S8 family serine peptidase [Bradyrhizobium iriomotense]|uniref:S8 family serine peptidase n=1 Tax=Bradyrhizobium iriomotense TaxID=441950 RepID=UPI001B8A527F|nr:S8 family serine peptidase [Bradyrhizobium iriomotense]MBR1126689.1 S8 family serine peptidase [Bradyrhizobium iriomotense]
MAKRGVNDQYGIFSEANANALEWEFIGLNIASANAGSMDTPAVAQVERHAAQPDVSVPDGNAPESFAAKKGGGGTTGGSSKGGGSTSSGGSTTTSTSAPDVYPTIPITWHALAPPTGDTALPTDPYFANWQWGLTNPTTGINVVSAWTNYTGAGVKIGIVDDGVDYNHSDLNSRYLLGLDYDATNGGADAYGTAADGHGTTVAGVLAAAHNGYGIAGIAYNSGIAGFRISYSSGGASQIADAFNHLVASGMDIANASWGYSTAFQDNFGTGSAARTAIQAGVTSGRNGLGTEFVFAAGNSRGSGDDVNYHNYQNSPYVITVAAIDYDGHFASFSTPGAALLVAAPGVGNTTDDRTGSAGYSTGDLTSASGTSYAAPTVAGVIALMLQSNPDLGYRDVMEILAYSAKNTDPTSAGWQTNGAHDWNGGGLHFSQDYGFGLVDATAAVRLAESWQKQSTYANLSIQSSSHLDNARIPDGSGSLQSTITLASSERLDKVVVDLNISHPHVSDLTVTLTSPSGTTATLINHPANGTGGGIVFETTANTFWGEDAKGNWTLSVTDNVTGNAGTLNSWTLTALGDAPSTPATYIYTDEFATSSGSSRYVLNDSSSMVTINTAAVTTGSYLDLHAGAVDSVAGKSLQLGASTIIKNVWAGDGNDIIIGNDLGNIIQAARGSDTVVAGKGADTIYGGPGNDIFAYNAFSSATDTICDFQPGSDGLDLSRLLASLGYAGTDPLADHWLVLEQTSRGTDFVIDPHNGQAPATVVSVLSIAPAELRAGIDYWTTAHTGLLV